MQYQDECKQTKAGRVWVWMHRLLSSSPLLRVACSINRPASHVSIAVRLDILPNPDSSSNMPFTFRLLPSIRSNVHYDAC
jgi:hypothetical protein